MASKGRKRSKRVRMLAVLGLVVVVALVAFFIYRAVRGDGEGEATYATQAAQRMTLTSSVSGIGNVSLTDTVSVDPGISGKVTGLAVEVGDTVEKGQLLFTIVNEELDLAVTDAENSLTQVNDTLTRAELAVLEAEESLADVEEQYEDQSSGSGSSSNTPSSSISTTTSFPIPTSTTIGSTTTTAVPTTCTTAPSTTTTLSATTTTVPAATTTTEPFVAVSMSLALAAASTESDMTVEPDNNEVVLTAQAVSSGTGSSSITELDLAIAEQELANAQTSVKVAETKVRSAELALEQAQEEAAKRSVTAPISGTITALGIEDGNEISGSGNASGSDTETLTITNTDYYEVSVTLAEADVYLVQMGQKATISVDALPDLTMTGKVIWVDVVGANNQGVVTYEVIVAPDVTDARVKGGMTASVNVITEVISDVLAVPNSAVKSDSTGGKYVQVLENDQPVPVMVEAGSSNDSYTEIVSGLDEGEEVVTQTVTSQTDSAAQPSGNSLLQGTGMPAGGGGMRPGGF